MENGTNNTRTQPQKAIKTGQEHDFVVINEWLKDIHMYLTWMTLLPLCTMFDILPTRRLVTKHLSLRNRGTGGRKKKVDGIGPAVTTSPCFGPHQ